MITCKISKYDEKYDVEITGVIRRITRDELLEVMSKIVDTDKQTEFIGDDVDQLLGD